MSTVEQAELEPTVLSVRWSDGHHSDFHHLWLRDNCPCSDCVHPSTHERTLDTFGIDPAIVGTAVAVENGSISVAWPDGHSSRYDQSWLRDHCYTHDDCRVGAARHTSWDAGFSVPELDYPTVVADDAALLQWLERLWEFGVTVLRAVPPDPEASPVLARRIEFLRNTNFGLTWDVVARPDAINNAYTGIALPAHTDLPNRELPPGLQFLHCLSSTTSGGDNVLVDGYRAADVLRERDESAWRLLQSVQLPYRFHDDDHDLRSRAPVIRLGPGGHYAEIRYHPALAAPLDVEPGLIGPVYEALRRFTEVLRDPAIELRLRLEPGDLLVFHNRRVLHGRLAFDEAVGDRHLAGCYVDIDELLSRIRVLRRQLYAG